MPRSTTKVTILTSNFISDAEIAHIGEGFLNRSLPKAEWTHAAHFAALLWLLRHRPDLRPETDMAALIRAYNEATGTENSDTSGYHETITQASITVTRTFMAGFAEQHPLFDLLNQLSASRLGRSDWPLAHWRRETLFSVEARRRWVDPDLLPVSLEI